MNSILINNVGECPLLKMLIDLGEQHRLYRHDRASSFKIHVENVSSWKLFVVFNVCKWNQLLLTNDFVCFSGLDKLVTHYQSSPNGLITQLTQHCCAEIPPNKARQLGQTNVLHRAVVEGKM